MWGERSRTLWLLICPDEEIEGQEEYICYISGFYHKLRVFIELLSFENRETKVM